MAIHGGYEQATTKAVAVPIYQTVAYEFDSADHGAALFNLEVEGHRYSRISNPTTAVLERRVAALEGGRGALCVSSGQAALNYAVLNLTGIGGDIVSISQLTVPRTRCLHTFCRARASMSALRESDQAEAIEKRIDKETRAIFCESIGNPAGNICDIEALAMVAARHGIPLIVDNPVATPVLLHPIDYGADIIVPSLTKFMGGHGTTLGGAIINSGHSRGGASAPLSDVQRTRSLLPWPYLHGALWSGGYISRCRSVYQRTTGAVFAPIRPFSCCKGLRRLHCASSVTSRMRAGSLISFTAIRA